MLVSRLARSPYVNLVNILLRRPVVPELLQGACTPRRLADAVAALLTEGDRRAAQMEAAAEALRMLTPSVGLPSRAAAETVLKVIDGKMPASTAAAS
jgi:lipid-A-disaccharide synthase